jgi:hypothetical protein
LGWEVTPCKDWFRCFCSSAFALPLSEACANCEAETRRNIATVQAKLGLFEDAWRSIGEAMTAVETTKETWFEAELRRIAGQIDAPATSARVSTARSQSRVPSKQDPWNSAPP